MATVTESTLEEIKARTDLADLIASYGVTLRRSGSSLKACCPFHNERTPSFCINQSKGYYYCFGCGEKGDAITFVMRQEGLPFMDAVRKLANQCGVKIEEREDPDAVKRKRLHALMAELAQFYHRCLAKTAEAQPARDYLASRALDGKTCDDFLIGYAPDGAAAIVKWAEKYGYTMDELAAAGVVKPADRPGDRPYHRFGGRLMFSVRDRQGRVVAFSGRQIVERKNSGKYVNSPETLIFKKSNVLFGFDRAAANIANSPHREAIVCEGQIDTIRLHICGFPVAVASQGTAFTEEHARMLSRVADAAVLVFDDDAAGHKATVRTAALLLAAGMPVRVVSLPDGDDPDSFLRTKGAAAFQALLDGAASIVAFQCRMERAKERNPDSIDAVARVSKAVLATIAASPNAVLRASMAEEAARLMGLPVAALGEELAAARAVSAGKAKPPPATPPVPASGMAEARRDESMQGQDARAAEPPPAREMAFMEFLLVNEHEATLAEMAGEFLPDSLFAHDFTRRFVAAWRAGAASGDEALTAFAAGLSQEWRGWFDRLLVSAGRTDASGLSPSDIMQDYVRSLWRDRLARRRGDLPVTGGQAADAERLRISTDMKRLNMVKWHDVKDLLRQLMAEER